MLRETYSTIYIRKEQKPEFINLSCHLNNLEKEEPSTRKPSRRKEIIKITAEISETENIRTMGKKSMKQKTDFKNF